jgi:hypothetical protein
LRSGLVVDESDVTTTKVQGQTTPKTSELQRIDGGHAEKQRVHHARQRQRRYQADCGA